ncbi:hypothetical protein EI613_24785 [Azospirillum sp. 412522]|nr:hypothetical protein [Azospirillum sp. 412522]MBY6265111.1 hypothetical protein [Azospirillum sp. 412522]
MGTDQPKEPIIIEKLERILAATAKLLVRRDCIGAASTVVHGRPHVHPSPVDYYSDCVVWDVWFYMPADVYEALEGKGLIEKQIDEAFNEVISGASHSDRANISIKIDYEQDFNEGWRDEISRILSGELISNQGRVRSTNIAHLQHEGLLFRSEPEIFFYKAAKKRGIPIAPLPVFIQGGNDYHRTEPDFLIVKDGVCLLVELDGNMFHRETPVQAQNRLRFLTQQGAHLYRLEAKRCVTIQGAEECVSEVIENIHILTRKLR